MQDKLVIAIDFDGTCVTHEYPKVGKDIGAVPVLKRLVAEGHRLMLWTMRGNKTNTTLDDAVQWFKDNDIPLWGINENPEQKESGWSLSNKQYAQLYLDDAALGCPLIHPYDVAVREADGSFREPYSSRPFVDWQKVELMLEDNGVLPYEKRLENVRILD